MWMPRAWASPPAVRILTPGAGRREALGDSVLPFSPSTTPLNGSSATHRVNRVLRMHAANRTGYLSEAFMQLLLLVLVKLSHCTAIWLTKPAVLSVGRMWGSISANENTRKPRGSRQTTASGAHT